MHPLENQMTHALMSLNNLNLNLGSLGGKINKASESIDGVQLGITSLKVEFMKSIGELNQEIKNYSDSADKQANAMKWLTGALVFVGLLQVIIPFIHFTK